MGRPVKAAQALVRARAHALVSLDDTRVVRLTERFLELRRQAFRDAVDTVAELGEILREGRTLLAGVYLRWTEDRLGIDYKTARNYEALAHLAAEAPDVIQRFKELGPSKLYRVARLAPAARRVVLRTPDLHDMTDQAFAEVVAPYIVKGRPVTGNMRAHGLRMKAQAFGERLRRLRLPAIRDDAMRAGLRDDLIALADEIKRLASRLG
ncbi:MAG: hypothetical protein AABZ30_15950 [Myxococcota bacterium]